MSVVPALYDCRVSHVRRTPSRNAFRYRTYLWLVDLDELPRLPRPLQTLGRFESRDHIGDPSVSIKQNVIDLLRERGIDLDGGRVLMMASARTFGYVFNPISVHWCYHARGDLRAVVAEVHNTYGQRHAYVLPVTTAALSTGGVDARVGKEFYVSPFLEVEGGYRIRVTEPSERVGVGISLHQGGTVPFGAGVVGVARPVRARNLLALAVRVPFVTYRVSALIRWQGLKLWLRRIPVVPRTAVRQPDSQRGAR